MSSSPRLFQGRSHLALASRNPRRSARFLGTLGAEEIQPGWWRCQGLILNLVEDGPGVPEIELRLHPDDPTAYFNLLQDKGLILDSQTDPEGQLSHAFTDPNGFAIRVCEWPLELAAAPASSPALATPPPLALAVGTQLFKDTANFWVHIGFEPRPRRARHPHFAAIAGDWEIGAQQLAGIPRLALEFMLPAAQLEDFPWKGASPITGGRLLLRAPDGWSTFASPLDSKA